jgi:hypothetical protein
MNRGGSPFADFKLRERVEALAHSRRSVCRHRVRTLCPRALDNVVDVGAREHMVGSRRGVIDIARLVEPYRFHDPVGGQLGDDQVDEPYLVGGDATAVEIRRKGFDSSLTVESYKRADKEPQAVSLFLRQFQPHPSAAEKPDDRVAGKSGSG